MPRRNRAWNRAVQPERVGADVHLRGEGSIGSGSGKRSLGGAVGAG